MDRTERKSSSRSVRHMSVEKVERKRAFDRVNQRCSRARTKARVAKLEQDVQELKALLQSAEDENDRLRKLLGNIGALSSNLQKSLIEVAYLSQEPRHQFSSALRGEQLERKAAFVDVIPAESGIEDTILHNQKVALESEPIILNNGDSRAVREAEPISQQTCGLNNAHAVLDALHDGSCSIIDSAAGFTFGLNCSEPDDTLALRPGSSPFTAPEASIRKSLIDAAFPSVEFDLPAIQFSAIGLPSNDDLLDINILAEEPWAGSLEEAWSNARTSKKHSIPPPPPSTNNPPIWSIALKHTKPERRLEYLMINMANCLRDGTSKHSAASELQSDSFPSIRSLLNPQDQCQSMPAAAALGKHGYWMGLHLPERMAVLHTIARLVRWQVQPNKASWDALPPSLRPTEVQRRHVHPSWIDAMQWPAVRDAIILRSDWNIFDQLRISFNTTFRINWPHDPKDIFVSLGQNEVALSPAFKAHIRDVSNWTCDNEWKGDLAFLDDLIPKPRPRSESKSDA